MKSILIGAFTGKGPGAASGFVVLKQCNRAFQNQYILEILQLGMIQQFKARQN